MVVDYNIETIILNGPAGSIAINKKDKLARKLAMLFENKCLGLKAKEAARKYGFSRPRFYQVKQAFEKGGSEALVEQKRDHIEIMFVQIPLIRLFACVF